MTRLATLALATTHEKEGPVAVQLYGDRPETLRTAIPPLESNWPESRSSPKA